jgi:hypothetical protein
MIVSFDFDKTLSRPDVQEYAKELLSLGVDVWVITARYDDLHKHLYIDDYGDNPNQDLWEVVDKIGIPRWKVKYMNMVPKAFFLKKTNVIWHLDDNITELFDIKTSDVKAIGIQVNSDTWKRKCDKLLGLKKRK